AARAGAFQPGGRGANQAVAAANDGARVVMAGAVGADALAAPALAGLVAAGVDVSRVARAHAPTGFASVVTDPTHARQVAVALNANLLARAEQVEDALLTPDATLIVQTETDPAETGLLIMRARRRGARIVLNLSPPLAMAAEALRALDWLVVDEAEAAWLGHRLATGDNPASLHAALGVGVVCSRATEGVEAVSADGHWRVPAHRVHLEDTRCAGDVLTGVLAACLDRAMPTAAALRRANAAAALSCTRASSQASFPSAAEIDAMLRESRHAEAL
ncbi:MAG: ribokinase, partial [Alphaproteobacteria bacterium]|nr:ribokinase [Alphaproteobacteria bacterium]